ncbi:hypothetical protein CEXT_711391 [Caerostris extrusa]|uniref:Uncharacterized protein n=1 Tax=Caerostris extrusa TaxID=172846 RepID=A0AAV4Y5J2_CAEEX|nr:hypothetical protein CEXT_711391 [Caerostris extrusa]
MNCDINHRMADVIEQLDDAILLFARTLNRKLIALSLVSLNNTKRPLLENTTRSKTPDFLATIFAGPGIMRGTLIMSVACKLWFHHLRCHDGWILEDANSRSGSLDRLIKVHFGNYHFCFCCGCHRGCSGEQVTRQCGYRM